MAHRLRLRRIGNSLGLTLPKESLAALGLAEGDGLFLTETAEGFFLTPFDPTFEAALTAFAEGESRYRDALRVLSKRT